MTVLDVSPPVVTYCPQSKSVFLEPGKVMTSLLSLSMIIFVQSSQKVYWSEPTFKDNVKIEQIEASALPGGDLSLGKHVIVYQVSLSEIVSDNIP